jgi:hypothetical protein
MEISVLLEQLVWIMGLESSDSSDQSFLRNIKSYLLVSKYHFLEVKTHPRGAVVRVKAQRSGYPCFPGSNPTVGRGCCSFG